MSEPTLSESIARDNQARVDAATVPLHAQIAALTGQLAEAQESREAYRKMALLREAEATALREALAKAQAMLRRAATWPEDDNQGLRYHSLEASRDISAALGGQPPTGGRSA